MVDDEPHIVDFLAILLEEEGYRVLRAYDGQEALELAHRECVQLLISDVMMPRMSGLELLRRLRASRDLSSLPVILMSAVSRVEPVASVRFLPKPFDIERVLDLVNAELVAS